MTTCDNHYNLWNITSEFLSMIKLQDEKGKVLNYLIVVPVFASDFDSAYGFPIGIAYVSAALKASGRNVFTLNLNYKLEPQRLLKHTIIDKKIDVVLTGGFAFSFWDIKTIIDTAKEAKPDVITVVGGGIVTADPKTAMEAFECADYGVIGEGEITVNSLAHALETKNDAVDVDGVICFRKGKWSIRDKSPSIPDLNILPFPDYEGLEYGMLLEKPKGSLGINRFVKNNYVAYIFTSRSCPFLCTFCFHSCGNHYRKLSIDNIFKQLDLMHASYLIDGVWFEDELTFSDPEFVDEFCRRIKPYGYKWSCSIRADRVSKDMFLAMKDSGCVMVIMGIESADNKILKSMRKGITIEQTEKALELAAETGLLVHGLLIFGDLEETVETVEKSMKWWQTWQSLIWEGYQHLIYTYPGTHIYKVASERGIIKDRVQFLKDGCPCINISKMTEDEYNTLPVLLDILQAKNKLENVTIEPKSDFTVNISGRCPHCAKHIYFEHYEFVFRIAPEFCPCCGKAVSVNVIEHVCGETLNKNAEIFTREKNAAVWAVALNNFYWLLKAMPALSAEHVKFINKNEIILSAESGFHNYHNIIPDARTIKTLGSKEVFAPDIIRSNDIEIVIVPNNPRIFHEIKKQCAEEFPQVRQLVHITELM